jgi:hypothetical protein
VLMHRKGDGASAGAPEPGLRSKEADS